MKQAVWSLDNEISCFCFNFDEPFRVQFIKIKTSFTYISIDYKCNIKFNINFFTRSLAASATPTCSPLTDEIKYA